MEESAAESGAESRTGSGADDSRVTRAGAAVADASPSATRVPQRINPGLPTRVAYGFGSVAYGVKNNGFDYLLLIFYSQVLGADASVVGAALLIALMLDAVTDPIIGYASDNLRTRWGRRHPFMYFAALPVALSYYLLWNPPADLRGNDLFLYLLVLAVAIRALITLYEVPSSALVAELTDDYDERTQILSFRYFFGWTGGLAMVAFALAFLLVPTETISNGFFNLEGFSRYGVIAASVIFTAIMISALGTHSFIPYLRSPPPKRPMTLKTVFGELVETLANRSFLALFLAALCGAVATGLAAGLNYYINSFFWGFTNQEISLLTTSVFLSAVMAFFLAPQVSMRLGKKKGAILIGIFAFTTAPLPIFLRLIGLMPENGSPALFPVVCVMSVIDVALIIVFQILTASMIADIVEQSELRTGRRSEGTFFAAITFSRKFVQGFGVVSATVILTLAQFPPGAAPGEVSEDTLFRLGMYYAPSVFIVWMLMIACLRLYRIDRDAHEANLAALREKAGNPG
ncbi:MAG: MFS transporter [Pseudomonadota bacterium]